ncbi:hypothetical protein LTR56_014397 [Elasticomyces elasticus]|nr:hypothetical protein LTR56_014397 [Elasticomyces elasticus]KAK4916664.1 hypothetical protein LTR49_015362 [Elasticomyces elasticus]
MAENGVTAMTGVKRSLAFSRRELVKATSTIDNSAHHYAAFASSCGVLPRLVYDPAFSNVTEKRYFQFFRLQTTHNSNTLIGSSRFWDRVVLQLAHREPSIKHAVLALSALHQCLDLRDDDPAKAAHLNFAERQHLKALAATKTLVASTTEEDIDRVLAACVVFICYEGIRGDYAASSTHIDSGRAIVKAHSTRLRQGTRRNDLVEIQQALARYDLAALTFQDTSAVPVCVDEYYLDHPLFEVPSEFHSFSEAHSSYTDLGRFIWIADIPAMVRVSGELAWDVKTYRMEMSKLTHQMDLWLERFNEWLQRNPDASQDLSIAMLMLMHAAGTAAIRAGEFGKESRWDAVQPLFAEVISLAEQVVEGLGQDGRYSSFSTEQGCASNNLVCCCAPQNLTVLADVASTFFAATRCRDPTIRRSAIKVLRRLPRQEGIWESTGAAAIAQRWMEIEEEDLPAVACASDVPEGKRVFMVQTSIDIDRRSGNFQFHMTNPGHDSSEPVIKKEMVKW